MKTTAICLVSALGLATASADPAALSSPPSAKQLVAQVLANQHTRGFSARARMVVTSPAIDRRTLQLLIKGRREGNRTETLYLALYPTADKGRATVIRKDASGAVSGFLREPNGKTSPLNPEHLAVPLFGSDIFLDELGEDFWNWPSPKITGQGEVCRRACQIIDTRPAKARSAAHALVRVWISPETSLPLRIESYNSDGKLTKRSEVEHITRSGDHWVAEDLTVEPASPGHRTTLSFSKGSRDIDVPASDFTPEGIAKLLQE